MGANTFPKSDITFKESVSSAPCNEIAAADDPAAVAHEARVQGELNAQYRELKRQAQGMFEALKGRIGASNQEYLQEVFAKAAGDYASGRFLMQRLGADRQLDLPLVATLTQLRHDLLAGIESATAADQMLADSAIIAYRNMLRVQGWLGSLCLEVERQLFGQGPTAAAVGNADMREVLAMVERLEQQLLPALERSQRMMCRVLDRLESNDNPNGRARVSIGVAAQVNVR